MLLSREPDRRIIHFARQGGGYTDDRTSTLAGAMNFVHFVNSHAVVVLGVVAFLWLILAIWIARVQRRAHRAEEQLHAVLHGVSGENVPIMLADYLGIVRQTARTVEQVHREHREIASRFPTAVRHVGLVRFSPFHDTGGDQSFALALLDSRGDGVVVTALHSRSESRLYAKPIERGRSTYALTPEEMEAMARARGESYAAVN